MRDDINQDCDRHLSGAGFIGSVLSAPLSALAQSQDTTSQSAGQQDGSKGQNGQKQHRHSGQHKHQSGEAQGQQ
jgi:hypothetical protein